MLNWTFKQAGWKSGFYTRNEVVAVDVKMKPFVSRTVARVEWTSLFSLGEIDTQPCAVTGSLFPRAGGWSTVAARHSLDSDGIYGHSAVQVCRIGASGCLKQHLLPLPAWILHRKFAQKQLGALFFFFFFWRRGIRFGLSHVSTYTSTASLLSQINGCPSSRIRIRSWHNAEDYGTERKAIVLLTSKTKPPPPSRSPVLLTYFHGRSWRSSRHGHFRVNPSCIWKVPQLFLGLTNWPHQPCRTLASSLPIIVPHLRSTLL